MLMAGRIDKHQEMEKQFFAQKVGMWIAMVSMVMLFAAFTSAYIVKKADYAYWNNFQIPKVFYISTVIILLSSYTIYLAQRSFNAEKIKVYRNFLWLTLGLGILFCFLQIWGWNEMLAQGIFLNEDVSGAFFYIISGSHLTHLAGGLIVLIVSLVRITRKIKDPVYDLTLVISPERKHRVGLVSMFWHFLDVLWVYLFLFLMFNHL